MNGLMMDTQLTITSIMQHAELVFPNTEIVSVTADNPCHRYTYRDAFRRSAQLANALAEIGFEQGDRIATLAWNDYRHFELYYAISCSGLVCHTINPRLFAEQIEYIANHAEDQWVFVDVAFVPLLEGLQDKLKTVRGFVILTDEENMPSTSLLNAQCYERLIAGQPDTFSWPDLDEKTASSLCYTSGTTGNPKGVLYSHRSTVLHSIVGASVDIFKLSSDDVVMPIVPMFHVNAWGTAYSCPMMGAKLVFPGPKMADGATLANLINDEKVNYSLGVPTIWLALLNYLDESSETIESLKHVVVGGAACSLSIMQRMENYGVWMNSAWGMTEMSPLGTYNFQTQLMKESSQKNINSQRVRAGRKAYGVDMKIVDEQGVELPWDEMQAGTLKVRGPWVISDYYRAEGHSALDEDGWLDTGDVAVIDEYGYVSITDRIKDVIKSGGEWISSIEVENAAMDHEQVFEAAVIGVPSEKWTERPLLIVVPVKGVSPDAKEILSSLSGKIAKWWIPEKCVFVEDIPHTATGKVSKKDLRTLFAGERVE